MNRLLPLSLALALSLTTFAADGPELPTPFPVHYSSADIDHTPKGNISFHGTFDRETLHVSADQLPDHAFLDISFDLLIIRTWDGALDVTSPDQKPSRNGPDFFRLGIRNGATLLYNSFANRPSAADPRDDSLCQGYPSPLPGDRLDPATGAAAKNSLGYHYPDPGRDQLSPMDSLYHIHFIVPHTDKAVALELSGINLQEVTNEGWGVTDVKIRPLPASAIQKPTKDQIAAAFKACLDPASPNLPEQFQTLINGMDDTTAWIATSVKPTPVDSNLIEKPLKEFSLTDESPENLQAREDAYKTLVDIGPYAEPALRDARNTAVGNTRLRIDWALSTLGTRAPDTDVRPALLATRVLEIIRTDKALALRRKLLMN